MELVAHWWNRSWGRLTKQDIHVRYDRAAGVWHVHWTGRWVDREQTCSTITEAQDLASRWRTEAGGDWKDIA